MPSTHPEIEAAFRALQGLYRDEVTKYFAGQTCRAKLRAENIDAAHRAR